MRHMGTVMGVGSELFGHHAVTDLTILASQHEFGYRGTLRTDRLRFILLFRGEIIKVGHKIVELRIRNPVAVLRHGKWRIAAPGIFFRYGGGTLYDYFFQAGITKRPG